MVMPTTCEVCGEVYGDAENHVCGVSMSDDELIGVGAVILKSYKEVNGKIVVLAVLQEIKDKLYKALEQNDIVKASQHIYGVAYGKGLEKAMDIVEGVEEKIIYRKNENA